MNKIISPRKFIIGLTISLSIFISYHLVVWSLYTSKIFDYKDDWIIGDLGRMSYQVDLLHKRKIEYQLAKQHLNQDNYVNQQIDVLTIGDSFSNAGARGLNPYYQDYLAMIYNKNILNIQVEKDKNQMETIIGLLNNGILMKLKPKVIILESVEREIVNRYGRIINFSYKSNITSIKNLLTTKVSNNEIPIPLIINTANYKIPYYLIKYKTKLNAIKSVYKFPLNRDLFSGNVQNQLLIYDDDINNINYFTNDKIIEVNNNFNKLALKLSQNGIKLYVMPAVDKYDLYYPFIVNNPYPNNNFFNLIRPLKKEYFFVDTKAILLPLLDKGVKDLYYADDTHWSYKASESIANDKIFYILKD